MGYEIKLIIGSKCNAMTGKKIERSKVGEIDGDSVYYPYLKNEDGTFKYTDVNETYFMVYAEIDMCKIGDSNLASVLTVNKNDKDELYYYGTDGNTKITRDLYDDKPNTTSISECIAALKIDVEQSDYRRFKWALALLESMKDEKDISVIWFGH